MMILVFHNRTRIEKIIGGHTDLDAINKENIAEGIQQLANFFPDAKIVWCHSELESELNVAKIELVFHHDRMMLSYAANTEPYLGNAIGYVEESPFIKVNKAVTYPSWLMSSEVGVIHASVLLLVRDKIKLDSNFDYYLNSVAKVCMILGLFCYSEPDLLLTKKGSKDYSIANAYTLFRFVKQHYKKRWSFLLFLNLLVFEKKLALFPYLMGVFYKNRKKTNLTLDSIVLQSSRQLVKEKTIDVIIPTIGRKNYVYDVLKDLAKQTHLPVNVIVIEQNPDVNSYSELDFITLESWPFKIKHTFTHQSGACNARNLALSQVESEWVFMADDDIRFDTLLLTTAMNKAKRYGISSVTVSCLLPKQIQLYTMVHQSGIFATGCSFVKTSALQKVRFDMALEFGYGEDTDFGMQLRNQGYDIIYFPEINITHLKAPMGGFRTKRPQQWDMEGVLLKPSPTIMYVRLKHYTKEQLNCYQLVLFLKLIRKESFWSYATFYREFKLKWSLSMFWAKKIGNEV